MPALDLHPEEPWLGPFACVDEEGLRGCLPAGRALVLVDGRSAGGKTTLAATLARLVQADLVHVDDVSWYLDAVHWDELMLAGVLEPWLRGDDVRLRPAAWDERGRPGEITVCGDRALVVEGVGAGRASLAPHADLVAWVQSDRAEARRRGLLRDAQEGRPADEVEPFWDAWMEREEPFLAEDRPWERAGLAVLGTPPDGGSDRWWVARGPAAGGARPVDAQESLSSSRCRR